MSEQYFNPLTKAMESREEMMERPADAETVLPVELTWADIKASKGFPPGCGIVLSGPIEWRGNETMAEALLRALEERRVVFLKNFEDPPQAPGC